MARQVDPNEYYYDLPDDPEAKLIAFESMMREILEANTNSSGWDAERTYMEAMHAFSQVFGQELVDVPEPPEDDGNDFAAYYRLHSGRIRTAIIKVRLRNTAGMTMQSDRIVILNDEAKSAIRQLLSTIQEKLDVMELTDAKKRQLIAKLHAFASELDQKLTRTEAMFSFAADAARAMREAGVELKPFTDRVDRVLDMIDRAEKWVESLPKWRDGKQIEGPPKQIEPPSTDDDIPF